jgi:hypothetical protein
VAGVAAHVVVVVVVGPVEARAVAGLDAAFVFVWVVEASSAEEAGLDAAEVVDGLAAGPSDDVAVVVEVLDEARVVVVEAGPVEARAAVEFGAQEQLLFALAVVR